MKYFLPLILILLAFSACNDDAATSTSAEPGTDVTAPPSVVPGDDGISETTMVLDETTGEPVLAEKPVNAISTMIGPNPVKKLDPVTPRNELPVARTPQEEKVIKTLVNNYWVIKTLIRIKDKPANFQNQGAWFKFKLNGTYDYGFFEEKIGRGAWSVDGQKALLKMDSELLGDDREWEFKMGNDGDVMIWVGTETYHTNDIQMRLFNFNSIPKNRTEMGLDEKNGRNEQ